MWTARRARWNIWKRTGVNWDYVESQRMKAIIRHQRRVNGCANQCMSRNMSTNCSITSDECCCKLKDAKPCTCSSSNRSLTQHAESSKLHKRSHAKKTSVERSEFMRSPEVKSAKPLVHPCSNILVGD